MCGLCNYAICNYCHKEISRGKGLGKDESGITQAIKPKLKFDNSGIGYDGAENFTYFWWQNAFNSASKSIDICKTEDEISLKTSQEFDISTKKVSSKKRKNLIFNNFLKSATTLTNEGLVTAMPDDEDEEGTELYGDGVELPLTDEDLFRACGGRTAHKGARHGLKLSGKLARVEEQERRLLSMLPTDKKMQIALSQEGGKINLHNESTEHGKGDTNVPKKHKKKKSIAVFENLEDNTPVKKVKKQKKNKNVCLLDASLRLELLEANDACVFDNSIDKRKKKQLEKDDVWADSTVLENTVKKRKKSKRKDITFSCMEGEQSTTLSENSVRKQKKKKRQKISDSEEVLSDSNSQSNSSLIDDADNIVKKAKKSKRK